MPCSIYVELEAPPVERCYCGSWPARAGPDWPEPARLSVVMTRRNNYVDINLSSQRRRRRQSASRRIIIISGRLDADERARLSIAH